MAWTERYVSVAGGGAHDGTTEADAWTLAEAIAAYASGQRLNVKAGTYANTTNNRTFGTSGTTTAPVWWRGYKTAIGDMDAEPSSIRVAGTDIPSFTFTSGIVTLSGSHQIFSSIDIQGSAPGGRLVGGSGAYLKLDRVRIECTENSSGSYAARLDGNGLVIARSWIKAHAGAGAVGIFEERGMLLATVFRGGGNGVQIGDGSTLVPQVIRCVFDGNGNHAIVVTNGVAGGQLVIVGNSIYGPGGDGIRLANVVAAGVIADNILESCGGYGINNNSGANTNTIHRSNNDFRNNTSGNENGFGDSPSLAEQAESSSPFVNASGHDFTLVSGANARQNAAPRLFENESYQSKADIGAVGFEGAGGSGGGIPIIGGVIVRAA